ncbi:MLO-like protein 8 [Linum perenne]
MKLVWLALCFWLLHGGQVAVVMASGQCGSQRELNQTPTWAVAGVCAVIIVISIILEKILHKLGAWFTERHKRALFEALEKVKAELMVLGFISLLLNFCQNFILKICIPVEVANSMLPCPAETEHKTEGEEEHHRRLLWFEHRVLAGADTATSCKEGNVPLISANGLHQLHILIFFLAVFHVMYSFITMMFGRLKIRGWKEWEQETSSHDYEFSNDPSRFRLTHEISFVRAHTKFWTRIPVFFYIGCFCRQFFRSVSKSDYMTLRNGFITVHLAPRSKFNFQQYIKRSLEDDFKLVVGVSPVLWASFVVFLLTNIYNKAYMLLAIMSGAQIILAVGTELQSILTKMALEITEKHAVVQGIPLVQYAFGLKSCFHASIKLAILKVSIGVGVLLFCSYITLPLYALVTQMGSNMKKAMFDEQTSKALKKWHMAVKKKKKQAGTVKGRKSSVRTLGSGSGDASPLSVDTSFTGRTLNSLGSSGHTLHRFKTTGHSTHSHYAYHDDSELSDMETVALSPTATSPSVHVSLISRSRRDHLEEDDEECKGHVALSDAVNVEMSDSRIHHHVGDDIVNGSDIEDFSFVKPVGPLKQP